MPLISCDTSKWPNVRAVIGVVCNDQRLYEQLADGLREAGFDVPQLRQVVCHGQLTLYEDIREAFQRAGYVLGEIESRSLNDEAMFRMDLRFSVFGDEAVAAALRMLNNAATAVEARPANLIKLLIFPRQFSISGVPVLLDAEWDGGTPIRRVGTAWAHLLGRSGRPLRQDMGQCVMYPTHVEIQVHPSRVAQRIALAMIEQGLASKQR